MQMQMQFSMSAPGPVPKMEPFSPHFSSSACIKCEPGEPKNAANPAFADIPSFQHHFQRMMSFDSMPCPSNSSHYVAHELQHSMVFGVSSPRQASGLLHNESPYSSMPVPNEVNTRTFSLQQPIFNNAPVITWESPAPAQRGSIPVKIKDEPEIDRGVEICEAPRQIEELRK